MGLVPSTHFLFLAQKIKFFCLPVKKSITTTVHYSIVVTLSPLISGDEAENLVALTCLYSTVLYSTVRCTNLTISHICRTFIVERIYRYVVKYQVINIAPNTICGLKNIFGECCTFRILYFCIMGTMGKKQWEGRKKAFFLPLLLLLLFLLLLIYVGSSVHCLQGILPVLRAHNYNLVNAPFALLYFYVVFCAVSHGKCRRYSLDCVAHCLLLY